jgi:hypothetical protein
MCGVLIGCGEYIRLLSKRQGPSYHRWRCGTKPCTRTSPEVGTMMPVRILMVVDFPYCEILSRFRERRSPRPISPARLVLGTEQCAQYLLE